MPLDGLTPTAVTAPRNATEFAAALAAASLAGQATVISGGGSKLAWGRPPVRLDLLISTAHLNQLVAHRHGDLTATVQAGASLADVNRQLARHGQWLPLDSAFDTATIGGIIATNDSGPLRHRFGTPRDLLIGVTLALTDGRLVKAGGTVVKNVAGYDLGRLMTGSFGSLAGIVDATFKLAPLPAASGTLGVLYRDPEAIASDVQLLAAHQFELTALDVQVTPATRGPEYRLLVRVASSPAATEEQLTAVGSLVGGEAHLVRGAAEADLWRDQVGAPWLGDVATLRFGWLPESLPRVLALIEEIGRATGAVLTMTARAAIGAAMLRVDSAGPAVVSVVERLRRRNDLVGNVVLLRAPAGVKRECDVWGPAGDAASVLRAIKQALDPAGILNAGRGPI